MKKLKEKLTLYLNTLSYELRSLIAHRKKKPNTPRLRKLCSVILCISFITYLFLGLFGCLKVSAVDVESSYTLSGVWRFNSELVNNNEFITSTPTSYNISFTSNNQQFDFVVLYGSGGIILRYEPTIGEPLVVYHPSYFDDTVWRDEVYRVIDFGSTPQIVSYEFYEWFTTNAKPLVTDLTGTTWTLDLKNENINGLGVFDVYGTACGVVESDFARLGIGYNYHDQTYDAMAGSLACVVGSTQYYNYWFDQGNGLVTLTFAGGADASSTTLIDIMEQYGSLVTHTQITDLTGYTVTVPAGWSQQNLPTTHSSFNISGILSDVLGPVVPEDVSFDRFVTYEHDEDFLVDFYADDNFIRSFRSLGFTIHIQGGTDVTSTTLIDWLYSNNASFTKAQEQDRITDLSGYIVSVPSGWVQDGLSSSYTRFSLSCDLTYISPSGSVDISSVTSISSSLYNNYFAIDFIYSGGAVTLYNGESFTLSNISGSSSTNSALISWLYYNNATFTPEADDDEMVLLDGNRVFNQNLVFDDGSLDNPQWNQDVSFVSNDVVYANMVNQYGQLRYGSSVVYDSSNGGWVADSYRYVEFLNASVPLWYYQWVGRNSSPTEPAYSLYGSYVLTNTSVDSDSLITFDKPFSANGVDFISIRFTDSADGDTISYIDSYNNEVVVYGSTGYSKLDYVVIFFGTDTTVSSDTYTRFNGYYTDLDDIAYGNLIYYSGQENGERLGIIKGLEEGYQDGYDEGYTVGYVEGSALVEDGFMTNFFGGIIDALDALTIFGPLSVLDILQAVLGFFIALWLLKLIAGG